MVPFHFLPFQYRRPYPYYTYCNKSQNLSCENKTNNSERSQEPSKIVSNQKTSSKHNRFANINLEYLFASDLQHPIVEILGLQLYLDDLIIIGLLFFLYKENVHDEILFGILLLLLLS